ncbi:hypothetical protein B9G69_011430 [Bdellovibrio sp. SKB1291214]|uniref:hypothetical protein n=1 Tax=Bdellovibrio sp. SKB1291214 TaxID=1732569 RepID=UPI000B515D41|nr:hypothetical protein [Bdellovibrio sp. SKB1291214]UYL07658.1 hypothetical protein B9G69_011430 [Bdellovibrio sp. SKB1291214]
MEKFFLRFPRQITFLLLSGALFALNACGGSSTNATGIDAYTQIGGTLTTANSDEISGIGKVRFVTPLSGILTNNSFVFKAALDGSINATTTIVFNSNDLNVSESSGIAIKFIRSGINVSCQIGVNGNWVTVASSITNMYAPLALDFVIDIHNNTGNSNKTRVVIWRYTPYSATTADIDTNSSSDLTGSYPSTQQAAGVYTGVIVNQATVTGAAVGTPKILN